jgi:predicted Zn-dependent protease
MSIGAPAAPALLRLLALAVAAALAAAACAVPGPVRPSPTPGAGGGAVQPASPPAAPGGAAPGEQPAAPPARGIQLGAAASALLQQAHAQASAGEYVAAGATLERALRIEPANPLLWIELGRMQLGEGNAPQADGMAHKALTLAGGDPTTQALAWHLIAESLRARGQTAEAQEAERRAEGATPR